MASTVAAGADRARPVCCGATPRLTAVPVESPAASSDSEMAVDIDGLVMAYGDKVAVDGLSLQVARGSITAVLGPNGAGKTTTLETCEGYRRPQAGTVRVLGLDPHRQRRELLPRMGVMLQAGGAWSGVRAMEMLDHIAALHAHPLDTGMLHDRLGLADCGRTPYRRLSGGQQQRLGLAMALVGRPELVFVDEPTAGMDPQARRTTWELLEEIRADGVTVVLTTHHMDEAEHLADQIHIIDHGRLIASGSPTELTERRPLGHDPARRHPALPRRRARVAGRRARSSDPGHPARRPQHADHRPGRRQHAAHRLAVGARATTSSRSRSPSDARPSRTSSSGLTGRELAG